MVPPLLSQHRCDTTAPIEARTPQHGTKDPCRAPESSGRLEQRPNCPPTDGRRATGQAGCHVAATGRHGRRFMPVRPRTPACRGADVRSRWPTTTSSRPTPSSSNGTAGLPGNHSLTAEGSTPSVPTGPIDSSSRSARCTAGATMPATVARRGRIPGPWGGCPSSHDRCGWGEDRRRGVSVPRGPSAGQAFPQPRGNARQVVPFHEVRHRGRRGHRARRPGAFGPRRPGPAARAPPALQKTWRDRPGHAVAARANRRGERPDRAVLPDYADLWVMPTSTPMALPGG
jgi:hypothetical protein